MKDRLRKLLNYGNNKLILKNGNYLNFKMKTFKMKTSNVVNVKIITNKLGEIQLPYFDSLYPRHSNTPLQKIFVVGITNFVVPY